MRTPRFKILCLGLALLALGFFSIERLNRPGEGELPQVAVTTVKSATTPSVVQSTAPRLTTVPDAPASPKSPAVESPSVAPPPSYPQMVLEEVVRSENLFQDDVFGVSVTFPKGWSVVTARRWGENNRENTVFFRPPEPFAVQPSMYYQAHRDPPPERDRAEAYLREIAQSKEDSRSGKGENDYRNVPGSFEYKEINGRPALTYSAVYTHAGQVMTEYFVRILGEKEYVMFFVRGHPEDVQTLVPEVNQMAATVKVP